MGAANWLIAMAFLDYRSRYQNQQIGTPICFSPAYTGLPQDFHVAGFAGSRLGRGTSASCRSRSSIAD